MLRVKAENSDTKGGDGPTGGNTVVASCRVSIPDTQALKEHPGLQGSWRRLNTSFAGCELHLT
jgi:hypothetical protein